LNEQILSDGAHYELSIMYHSIILDRLLDCINAIKNNVIFDTQNELYIFLMEKAIKMLGWLESIIYKDGSIPLLNDTACGVAPSPIELFQYAKRLELSWTKIELKDSGYRKFETLQLEILVDIGRIGPDYILGHSHADTFTYELKINQTSFVVDTGISTYNKNKRRQYERGTSAHNTVSVNSSNSSQVWGGFRVGKRAKVSVLKDDPQCIIAIHNGFGNIMHKREFIFNKQAITIKDDLLGKIKEGCGYIILSPEVKLISIDNASINTNFASIIFNYSNRIQIENCEIAYEYNSLKQTKKICYFFDNHFEYTIIPNL
jgi:uncharacterized heparinase superfamily protein